MIEHRGKAYHMINLKAPKRLEEMSKSAVQSELLDQLDRLPLERQRQVLDFARAAAQAPGTHPDELLRFGGAINAEDLIAIVGAIEEGCE